MKIFKKIYRGFKNIFCYLPLIWNDRDFDQYFFLILIKKKLEKMAKYYKHNGITISSNRKSKQINYATFLLNRIIKDNYFPEKQKELTDKWGEVETKLQENKNLLFTHSKASPEEEKQIWEEEKLLWKAQSLELKNDHKRLFKHINKYLNLWWD